jgi:hypothetical protein
MDSLSPDDVTFALLMKMKVQLDCHCQNGTRQPKDLCVLYKKFMLYAQEIVIPRLQKQKEAK